MNRVQFRTLIANIPLSVRIYKILKRPFEYASFISNFRHLKALSIGKEQRFSLRWKDLYPCLEDRTPRTGFDQHYIYHLAWAARILAQNMPELHIDISSSLYFSTIVSAFLPVRLYDYRPADLSLTNLSCGGVDLSALPFENQSVRSISCMHVVEHIGLGRYGDTLDPDGDLKAISELKRILAIGGSMLFVVPIGKPKIMFNAHRIYLYEQIISYFQELELREFTLIHDQPKDGGMIQNATREMADAQDYGCGCFWFRRKT